MTSKKWNVVCQNLCADEKVSGCVIASYDAKNWGNRDLYATPMELKQIIEGFTPDGCEHLRENGIRIMGDKYWLASCDDQVIRGTRGKYGFAAVKAKTCVVIGTWDSKTSAGFASNRIENLASYIRANGF